MSTGTLPARNELDPAFTWNLEALYATKDEYLADYEKAKDQLEELKAFQGRLGEDAQTLATFMELYFELSDRINRLAIYATLPVSVDQSNPDTHELAGHFQALASEAMTAVAFGQPELLAVGSEALQGSIREEAPLPGLGRASPRRRPASPCPPLRSCSLTSSRSVRRSCRASRARRSASRTWSATSNCSRRAANTSARRRSKRSWAGLATRSARSRTPTTASPTANFPSSR